MTLQDTIGEGGRRGADSRGVREDSLERWSSDTGGQAYQAERQRIFPFEGGQGKSEEVIGALSQLEFGSHHFCKRVGNLFRLYMTQSPELQNKNGRS